MTKRELLREQYEEALFALLMDDLAVSEGKKALEENERLKKDLCYIIPKESQLKCEKTIANHFTKNTIRTIGASISRAISKVAIIALISMLLFTTAFALSPSFRAHTLNLVIETFYDRTDFHFSELPSQANEKSSIEAAWLPVDFFLDAQSSDSVTSPIILPTAQKLKFLEFVVQAVFLA